MKKPNFFILGSVRCGTTSLYHMLEQHNEIFMSHIKEPSFFCSYFQVVKNPVHYFNLFKKCKKEKAVGEASHVYFSNPETPIIIKTLFPKSKFILILRNPINRAYSLYNWARRRGVEPIGSFMKALEEEEIRYKDKKFIKKCPYYFWDFMYVRSSYYDIQLKRYLSLFSKDRFFILSLYEFANDPLMMVKQIYNFLGVDPSYKPTFRHHNKAKYNEMTPEEVKYLTKKFKETISKTEEMAERKLYLDKI